MESLTICRVNASLSSTLLIQYAFQGKQNTLLGSSLKAIVL